MNVAKGKTMKEAVVSALIIAVGVGVLAPILSRLAAKFLPA